MGYRRKIVITGGLGHIGSKLIHSFGKDDWVVVVDNMLTQRYCSLFNRSEKFDFLEKSVDQLDHMDLRGTDIIIHLAAVTDAANSINNANLVEQINLEQTKTLVENVAHSCPRALFIYPSTTSVYGKNEKVISEDTKDAINPQSPYASSKYAAEEYIRQNLKNYAIFRFGTIFGTSPGMRFHTAVNKFCYQAANGLPVTVWEQNYHMKRPYLGINDAVRLIKFAANRRALDNRTLNAATGNYELSFIIDIIKTFVPNLKIDFIQTPLLNQYSYIVDTSKISEVFWFKDSIAQGIQETLELLR
jgi:nucleoside-diphosphate-sugar epimerase